MEKRWIHAAVCQLGAESPNPGENLDRAERWSGGGRGMPDLDLILLPECVDFLARSPEEALTLAQPIPGPYTMRMSRLARELHVNLVPGSITERTESGKVRNTTVWIDRRGRSWGGTPSCTCLTP